MLGTKLMPRLLRRGGFTMTDFNRIPKPNSDEAIALPDRVFEKGSLELRAEIERLCLQLLASQDFLNTIYGDTLEKVSTLDKAVLNKFIDSFVEYFSSESYIDGFFGSLKRLDLEYCHLFHHLVSFLRIKVK
jgi:hypothetical protein